MKPTPTELRRVLRIPNKLGLHARPAAEFVKVANSYGATIIVAKDDVEVNGKSIMGMMMLAAEFGSEITIRAQGDDAENAIDALTDLVGRGFGEA